MGKPGKVTIVGAGPGDPDLITVKGLKALRSCDVVLYDALANDELLSHVPAHALQIYVGKRSGSHSTPQERIEDMMVRLAHQKSHVVRLKGGDPFVFGRGHEELEYLSSFGIEVEIVPGISSAISVPASQNIPVTRRGISESFWVVTATTKKGTLSDDIAIAASSSATIVILMGLRKLPEIVEAFRKLQKGYMPVMVIQNGTLPNEKCVASTIDKIEEAVEREQISTPAIIVVGEVVSLHHSLVNHLQVSAI